MRYLLDTNTVGYLLRGNPNVFQHVEAVPMSSLGVSVVTEGELLFGLAKRPEATRLRLLVSEFLKRVDVFLWDRVTAERYGILRAQLSQAGKSLSPLDLMIAAHALTLGATLVTHDAAFSECPQLVIQDWVTSVPTPL